MKKTFLRVGLAIALAGTTALGLGACGSSSESTSGASVESGTSTTDTADSTTTTTSDGTESEAFIADMADGVKIVNDKLAEDSSMTQIMLASDVDQPTQKYGMWVMPYYPSDAVKKFTMSIQIEGGKNFVVTAVSADTGKTWTMDQDEKMVEAAE